MRSVSKCKPSTPPKTVSRNCGDNSGKFAPRLGLQWVCGGNQSFGLSWEWQFIEQGTSSGHLESVLWDRSSWGSGLLRWSHLMCVSTWVTSRLGARWEASRACVDLCEDLSHWRMDSVSGYSRSVRLNTYVRKLHGGWYIIFGHSFWICFHFRIVLDHSWAPDLTLN